MRQSIASGAAYRCAVRALSKRHKRVTDTPMRFQRCDARLTLRVAASMLRTASYEQARASDICVSSLRQARTAAVLRATSDCELQLWRRSPRPRPWQGLPVLARFPLAAAVIVCCRVPYEHPALAACNGCARLPYDYPDDTTPHRDAVASRCVAQRSRLLVQVSFVQISIRPGRGPARRGAPITHEQHSCDACFLIC